MHKYFLVLALCFATSPGMAQQNFSCSYGARGACLGYGDKVVDQNAVCFNSTTCGYKGFVCKSKLDDLVDEYDTLVNSHNDLIRKNKSLIDSAQELLNKNSAIVNDYNDLLYKFKRLNSDYEDRVEELRVLTNSYNQLVSAQRAAGSRSNESNQKKSK